MRTSDGRRTLSLALVAVVPLVLLGSACTSLIGANFDRTGQADGGEAGPGGGNVDGDGAVTGSNDGATDGGSSSKNDGASTSDSGSGGGIDAGTYEAAQAALEKLRYPGPTTAQGSTGRCTDSRFIWRDSDGTLHSWKAADESRVDYTFKQPTTSLHRWASDTYFPVDHSDYSTVDVYDTTQPNTLVKALPYAYDSAGGSDGVFLFTQIGAPTNATQAKHWTQSNDMTVNLGMQIPTPQPISSWRHGLAIYPGSVNAPYPLYILDTSNGSQTSVTFDGGTSIYDTLPTPAGLVVSYARSGPVPSIRLYQNNQDATRTEIGDEVANMASLYPDSPVNEHKFIAHVSADGNNLIYASAFGIFSYAIGPGTLRAVQLGPNKAVFVPDVMCVIESQHVLVYRVQGDAVGQLWIVPLNTILN
jgi:hypothetical protein